MTEHTPRTIGAGTGIWTLFASGRFKAAIAIAVVFLLVYFNRVDWRALYALNDTWSWLLAAFVLMMPPFAIVSYRFQVILRSQGVRVPLFLAARWTMIGSFFDLALPSSNGGDVIKAGYVIKHVGAGMRIRATMAVGIDRVLGLLGLFLLAGTVGLLGRQFVATMPGGNLLIVASLGASIGGLVLFRIVGARRLYHHPWLNQRLRQRPWGARLKRFVGAFNALRERPVYLMAALGLSMVNHTFWCSSLLCIAYAVGHDVAVIDGFLVFPLALFGNIFGVAGGFGLGTAGFDLLLSQLLGIANGALIGLVFQTLSAISKLAGLPFYLVDALPAACPQAPRNEHNGHV